MSKNNENNKNKHENCDCSNCNCQDHSECEEGISVSLCDESSEIEIQKRRADEMTYQAQRIQAEFDNYRRRTAEMNKQLKEDGRIEVIEKMLPALDAFNQAAKVITDQSTLKGINLIYDMLFSALSQLGLSKIEALGKSFDPNFHEGVMTKADNSPAGTILEVLQDGYILNGKVLRAAIVITSGN